MTAVLYKPCNSVCTIISVFSDSAQSSKTPTSGQHVAVPPPPLCPLAAPPLLGG